MKPSTLFFTGCVPTRAALAYFSYLVLNDEKFYIYKPYLLVTTFVIGISFMMIYAMDLRKTGIETQGGKIWWNSIRPIHSVIYIMFSIGLLYDIKDIYILLVLDLVLGIYAELFYKRK
jgi:hypothetical protein